MPEEPEYHFDAHTQREVLSDPDAARKWVEHLKSLGPPGDPMRVLWLRILRELEEAEALGWEVLHRSGGPSSKSDDLSAPLPLTAVTAAIRLAHVLQWKMDFSIAHALYEKALETIESVEPLSEDSAYADYLRPFAHQHLARCYFDQGKHEEALLTSQKALHLRITAGVPEDQVLSSSGLITAVRARLN